MFLSSNLSEVLIFFHYLHLNLTLLSHFITFPKLAYFLKFHHIYFKVHLIVFHHFLHCLPSLNRFHHFRLNHHHHHYNFLLTLLLLLLSLNALLFSLFLLHHHHHHHYPRFQFNYPTHHHSNFFILGFTFLHLQFFNYFCLLDHLFLKFTLQFFPVFNLAFQFVYFFIILPLFYSIFFLLSLTLPQIISLLHFQILLKVL